MYHATINATMLCLGCKDLSPCAIKPSSLSPGVNYLIHWKRRPGSHYWNKLRTNWKPLAHTPLLLLFKGLIFIDSESINYSFIQFIYLFIVYKSSSSNTGVLRSQLINLKVIFVLPIINPSTVIDIYKTSSCKD